MFSFFCDHENSFLNFSIIPRFISISIFTLCLNASTSSHFYFLKVDILPRFFKGTCNTRFFLFNSQIWLLVREKLFYVYFPFSIFILSLPLSTFFNVQVLFLALHTLINEFLLFPSFPALAYFPVRPAVSTSRLPRFSPVPLLFFILESLPSYPGLFLRQSRTVTTIHPSLDGVPTSLAFCHPFWTHELFPFRRRPFSLMSKRPQSFYHPLTHSPSRTFCSRSCMREQNLR